MLLIFKKVLKSRKSDMIEKLNRYISGVKTLELTNEKVK